MPTKQYQTISPTSDLDPQTADELRTLIRSLVRLLPDDALATIADKARRGSAVTLPDLLGGDRDAARALLTLAHATHKQQQMKLLDEALWAFKDNNNEGPETPEDN